MDRDSRKNIQLPYSEYTGHFCLGIIYTRASTTSIDETKFYALEQLDSIPSVIRDFQFFAIEKTNTEKIQRFQHFGQNLML